jgi:two-component system alkaline phosphatase synthesis response regulator PhoP
MKGAVRDVLKNLGEVKKMREMNKPQTILIIDDDLTVVIAMMHVLESKGYQVEAAYNKEEAIEKVMVLKPDLILLDIILERFTDGFFICCKLKHDPELMKIPVLAVSTMKEEFGFKYFPRTYGECFEADDFMEKPVIPIDLLERINKLLKAQKTR